MYCLTLSNRISVYFGPFEGGLGGVGAPLGASKALWFER